MSFASNDYLGLSQHPAPIAAAIEAVARLGTGSGASRLVVGSRPEHTLLEASLAEWKSSEAAVLFPTGYAANLGVVTTLATPGVLVCSDELNHASIIDGCRLARADAAVYPHGDLDALADLLEQAAGEGRRALVVSDLVFSMDGDAAAVDDLVALAHRHGAALVLDEAHAVFGPEPHDVPDDLVLVRVGTLSKTLGSLGGFVAAPKEICDLLVNRARTYIFTTAPSPADTAAAAAALEVLTGEEGAALVGRLRELVGRLRPGHPSPIVPVVVGAEADALALSAALLDRGLLVPAIRPPTVAPGTSRLRIAVSAAHTDEQVTALESALDALHPVWRDV